MRSIWTFCAIAVLSLNMISCEQEDIFNVMDTKADSYDDSFYVMSSNPPPGMISADVSADIVVYFSKTIDPASITTGAVTLKNTASGAYTPVTATTDDKMLIITHTALDAGTGYSLTIIASIKDSTGKSLGSDWFLNFVTPTAASFSVMGMTFTDGTNLYTDMNAVPCNATINLAFNMTIDGATVTSTSGYFEKNSSGTFLMESAAFSASGSVLTIQPSSAMTAATTYRVRITSELKNTNGLGLPSEYIATFITAP